jgi:hypothetical protein
MKEHLHIVVRKRYAEIFCTGGQCSKIPLFSYIFVFFLCKIVILNTFDLIYGIISCEIDIILHFCKL